MVCESDLHLKIHSWFVGSFGEGHVQYSCRYCLCSLSLLKVVPIHTLCVAVRSMFVVSLQFVFLSVFAPVEDLSVFVEQFGRCV